VGEQAIRGIQAALERRLGPDDGASLSYIASVLREAGTRVDYQDRFTDPLMEEPYASRLRGRLQFRDFPTAESSLRTLDAIYREYRAASDREGASLVRSLVLKGKQRAASLGSNPRISPQKRLEKQEIARWFRVWLETADLFFDWLELRKQSEEFQRLFSNNHRGAAPSGKSDRR
jgi:hypothetical protein